MKINTAVKAKLGSWALLVAGACAVVGCKPEYPACETDSDCKTEPKEFCVNRKCQQCRTSSDCKEGFSCNAGLCSAITGFCKDKSQCAAGEECIASRCRPCVTDGECPSGLICQKGTCSQPLCKKDDDCAQDEDCVSGRCVSVRRSSTSGAPCALSPVYFAFNDVALGPEATGALGTNNECLKTNPRPVNLTGRADPRGTVEYNLALSDKRSQAVKDYLQRLGIDPLRLIVVPRGALDAVGTDESSWAKDRRVDLEWH